MVRPLLAVLFFSALGWAQFDATVLGTVKDPTGLVVAGGKVTLANQTNGVQQTTTPDPNGDFQFLNARIGKYTLTAEREGFKAATADRFTVTVNSRQRVDLTLQVGATSEKVTVSGAAEI